MSDPAAFAEIPDYIEFALLVAAEEAVELADDAEGLNIDSRLIGILRYLGKEVTQGIPTRDTQYLLNDVQRALAGFQPMIDEEWPAILASRYRALRLMLWRISRHFPPMNQQFEDTWLEEWQRETA